MLFLLALSLARTPVPATPQRPPVVVTVDAAQPTPAVSAPAPTATSAPEPYFDDATILNWGRNFGKSLVAIAGLLSLLLIKMILVPTGKPEPQRERRRNEYRWDEPGMGGKALMKRSPQAVRAGRSPR